MSTVLLVVHLMIAAALVGVVLLQRSEGGALGIGGGGGGGGFLTGRGTANLLTRLTAGLAAAFFATSLLLSILAGSHISRDGVVGRGGAPAQTQPQAPPVAPAVPTVPSAPTDGGTAPAAPSGGILKKLQGEK